MATLPNPDFIKPVFPIAKDASGNLVHQTPEALHPAQLKGESPAAERARQAFKSISAALATANAERVAMHPAHRENLKRTFDGNAVALEQSRSAFKAEAKELEDRLIETSGFMVDPTAKGYVVGTIQSLSPNERINAVSQLIDEGDGASLAVLESVSNVFTGIPAEVRAGIRSRLFAAKDKATFDKLTTCKANLAKLEAASLANSHAMAAFHQPTNVAAPAKPVPVRSVAD